HASLRPTRAAPLLSTQTGEHPKRYRRLHPWARCPARPSIPWPHASDTDLASSLPARWMNLVVPTRGESAVCAVNWYDLVFGSPPRRGRPGRGPRARPGRRAPSARAARRGGQRGAAGGGRCPVDGQRPRVEGDAVVVAGRLARDVALDHVGADA